MPFLILSLGGDASPVSSLEGRAHCWWAYLKPRSGHRVGVSRERGVDRVWTCNCSGLTHTHTHVCIQSSSQYKVYWGGKKKEDLLFEVQGIQIDLSKQSYSRAEFRNARV